MLGILPHNSARSFYPFSMREDSPYMKLAIQLSVIRAHTEKKKRVHLL